MTKFRWPDQHGASPESRLELSGRTVRIFAFRLAGVVCTGGVTHRFRRTEAMCVLLAICIRSGRVVIIEFVPEAAVQEFIVDVNAARMKAKAEANADRLYSDLTCAFDGLRPLPQRTSASQEAEAEVARLLKRMTLRT